MMRFSSLFPLPPSRQRGFTLVEMIVVMVITGIIGSVVAVFIQAPVQGYVDSARRAELTDIADTAFRRVGRDLRLALPNSVRVSVDGLRVEFLPTKGGGRYRAAADPVATVTGCGSSAANVFDFNAADTCFEVLGPMPAVAVGDGIVVYNMGIAGPDAYAGDSALTHNRRPVIAAGTSASSIGITSANKLPSDSPGHRFHVITTPVSYICDAGTLWRYSGYVIQSAQTSTDTIAELDALIAVQGSRARLATLVGGCSFSYDSNVVAERSGLVAMRLGITQDSETISLYSATHVSNQP